MRTALPEYGVVHSSISRHLVLRHILQEEAKSHPRIRVLEVGSYEGASALLWRAQITEHCLLGGEVVCVDSWRPYLGEQCLSSEGAQRMEEDLRDGTAYQRFVRNVSDAEAAVPIRWYRAEFHSALDELLECEGKFDIVYLDGAHNYSAVRGDIAAARLLLRMGGVLCGDDLERQFPDVAEHERELGICELDYFQGFHPGVSRAVWEAFGRVWVDSAVWGVRSKLNGWEKPYG